MKKLLLLLATVAIVSCSTVRTSSYNSATNEIGATIKCKMFKNKCLERAREYCSGDYTEVSHTRNSGGVLSDVLPGPIIWHTVNIVCD